MPKAMIVWLVAAALLGVMLLLMLGSSQGDTFTFDEPSHITAGYAYLRFQDARHNPEHTPLLKMLAAAPLLRLGLQFPLDSSAWQDALKGQWETGRLFMYESGNDPHLIAEQARLVPIFLTLALGLGLFLWTKKFANESAALLTLFLYAWSPTILAHGRFVHFDVATACSVALAGFSFISFLKHPLVKTALISGLSLGIALILGKFSMFLLIPFFGALTLLWMFLERKKILGYFSGLVIIGVSASVLVLLPYLWITAQYPPERQLRDTYFKTNPVFRSEDDFTLLLQDRTRDLRACVSGIHPLRRCPGDLVIFLADKPVVRGWSRYLQGVVKVFGHAMHGQGLDVSGIYFLGEVSNSGWWYYFPLVYLMKETLPFHILTALALSLALTRVWSSCWGIHSVINWIRSHPAETLMLGWLALYWTMAMNAKLDIGERYLLPIYPFTLILVSREIGHWLTRPLGSVWHPTTRKGIKGVVLASLLAWQVVSVLLVYPALLAYFNEAVGGPDGGANYVVDSNLDWGQDLGRLRQFVDAHQIQTIAVDYFGTSSLRYELGEKGIPWRSALGPYQGWLAVSANTLITAQGRWDPALGHPAEDAYAWLRGKEPVAKIGHSIYVYDLRNVQ